jgi:hypothetical protein
MSSNSSSYTTRGPKSWEADLDALIPVLEASPFAQAFGKVTRATVLRVAIETGLKSLKAEHQIGSAPPVDDPRQSVLPGFVPLT